MENQRTFLIVALLAISAVLYQKWTEFSAPPSAPTTATESQAASVAPEPAALLPSGEPSTLGEEELPSADTTNIISSALLPEEGLQATVGSENLISIKTDLVIAKINLFGGAIESLELRDEAIESDKRDQGFPLLKKTALETFIAQDGLFLGNSAQKAPNHLYTKYKSVHTDYDLGAEDSVVVPLSWVSAAGVEYTKTFTFKRDSYVVDIDYKVENKSEEQWQGYLYAQFSRTEPLKSGGSFGRLPVFTGGAIYTEEKKFEKISFKDMRKQNIATKADGGWVAVLQHYFVGAWIPKNGTAKQMYSAVIQKQENPVYRIGYKTLQPVIVERGQSNVIGTSVYLGSKTQSRLKQLQKDRDINGLVKAVDYGYLTFIADPLFVVLNWIHGLVGNWGWAIILLTVLIKAVFYPLSAASYKSMAKMKKFQPRLKTLKERYKDDKQKYQMEMMALYKKEKINPVGGCLPVLIQIPVFIALYYVLLESVEIRHAPFALWLQDLSAKDPLYILPVLMGASQFVMMKLNPAPMDDIQKKVMTIMPIALTFLFLSFPQGLVLYWVVNNLLSMAQQWYIMRKHAA